MGNCQMTITKSGYNSVRTKRQNQLIFKEFHAKFFRKFTDAVSMSNSNKYQFRHFLGAEASFSNLSWSKAAEICRNLNGSVVHFSIGLFTYLTESELREVKDNLEREGFLDGSPLLVFTGFTGQSVSPVVCNMNTVKQYNFASILLHISEGFNFVSMLIYICK